MKSFVFAIGILILLFSCGEKGKDAVNNNDSLKQMPADFNFSMSQMDIDSYNSADSSYKYELRFRYDTCVKIAFTKVESEKVYAALVKNNFWNIPANFDAKPCVSDHDGKSIAARSRGTTWHVDVYYGCDHKDVNSLDHFENIFNVIDSILRTKSAYQGIPRHPLIRD